MNDDAQGETLSSRAVYSGKIVDLEVERVSLPNGSEVELEMIHHPGAAVVLALDGDAALMVRQYRHATGGYLHEVPGGKLDPGESPEECARREVEEEIGYRPLGLVDLGWIWTTPGFTDERIWLFMALEVEPGGSGPELDSNEVLTLERVPVADAYRMALDGEITDAKTVATLLRAGPRLGLGGG